MNNSIMEDFYYGRCVAWERKSQRTPENISLNKKIEDEKRYFIEKMSLDDCSRFQALDGLYLKSNEYEQIDAFSYGFKLATLLMVEIFMDNLFLDNDDVVKQIKELISSARDSIEKQVNNTMVMAYSGIL